MLLWAIQKPYAIKLQLPERMRETSRRKAGELMRSSMPGHCQGACSFHCTCSIASSTRYSYIMFGSFGICRQPPPQILSTSFLGVSNVTLNKRASSHSICRQLFFLNNQYSKRVQIAILCNHSGNIVETYDLDMGLESGKMCQKTGPKSLCKVEARTHSPTESPNRDH